MVALPLILLLQGERIAGTDEERNPAGGRERPSCWHSLRRHDPDQVRRVLLSRKSGAPRHCRKASAFVVWPQGVGEGVTEARPLS
jgi:hypothetical protein